MAAKFTIDTAVKIVMALLVIWELKYQQNLPLVLESISMLQAK